MLFFVLFSWLFVCAGLPCIGRIVLQIAALAAPFFIFLQGGVLIKDG